MSKIMPGYGPKTVPPPAKPPNQNPLSSLRQWFKPELRGRILQFTKERETHQLHLRVNSEDNEIDFLAREGRSETDILLRIKIHRPLDDLPVRARHILAARSCDTVTIINSIEITGPLRSKMEVMIKEVIAEVNSEALQAIQSAARPLDVCRSPETEHFFNPAYIWAQSNPRNGIIEVTSPHSYRIAGLEPAEMAILNQNLSGTRPARRTD